MWKITPSPPRGPGTFALSHLGDKFGKGKSKKGTLGRKKEERRKIKGKLKLKGLNKFLGGKKGKNGCIRSKNDFGEGEEEMIFD